MICLFGGTFDPIHLGHTHAAGRVCDALDLPAIHMVLSARPSHREPTGASLEQRWEMLCLVCAEDARLIADDREMRRAGPSYTVETLRGVRAEGVDEQVLWVIGSDALADLPSWYRWQEVLRLCNLVVLRRPGFDGAYPPLVADLVAERATAEAPSERAGQIYFVTAQMRDISASGVRRALLEGEEVAHLLNPQVGAYIRQHGLYRAPSER